MCIVSSQGMNVNQRKDRWSGRIVAACVCVLICKRNERWVPIIGGFRSRLGYMCRKGTKGLTWSNLDYLSHAGDQPQSCHRHDKQKCRSSLRTESSGCLQFEMLLRGILWNNVKHLEFKTPPYHYNKKFTLAIKNVFSHSCISTPFKYRKTDKIRKYSTAKKCTFAAIFILGYAYTPTSLSPMCDEAGMPPSGSTKYYSLKEKYREENEITKKVLR